MSKKQIGIIKVEKISWNVGQNIPIQVHYVSIED